MNEKIWNGFYRWMVKVWGQNLFGEWQYHVSKTEGGFRRVRYRSFNHAALTKKLFGIEVINKMCYYCGRYNQKIRFIKCDDPRYGGCLFLIPHPDAGVMLLFIPELQRNKNQFFIPKKCYKTALSELTKMAKHL